MFIVLFIESRVQSILLNDAIYFMESKVFLQILVLAGFSLR